MNTVTVIGSGPSGVHFAQRLLERGHRVRMLDVGHRAPEPARPDDSWIQLKERLPDPQRYFLGAELEGVVFPDDDSEFYGFPPDKAYIFRAPPDVEVRDRGFAALFSYARGGLAETWTAGCYPLRREEATDFPIDFAELERAYDHVAARIGVTGERDDLARFFPEHAHLQEPLPLDAQSTLLLNRYGKKRGRLHRRLGCYMGRTRVATLSRPLGERPACTRCGRCLWGCPRGSLYVPSLTLAECQRHPDFEYRDGFRVDSIELEGRVATAVRGVDLASGRVERIPVGPLALAAGTLSSARIFLRSIHERDGSSPALTGLMDNRQILMPFVNPGMLGRRYDPDTYQYHLLGMGLDNPDPREYVHCQLTTLKTALLHPVAQQLPFGLSAGLPITNALHAALGVLNVNFHDTRRAENTVRYDPDGGAGKLHLEYTPPEDEPERIAESLRRLRRALWSLGCIAPPSMAHVRPMGASVHYAGLLPMRSDPAPWSAAPSGRSHDVDNLYLVDGITFPFLPAKNGTFTLMANAVRIAEALDAELR